MSNLKINEDLLLDSPKSPKQNTHRSNFSCTSEVLGLENPRQSNCISELEFLGNDLVEENVKPQVEACITEQNSASILVQDFILLTDLVGISEFITLIRAQSFVKLDTMLLNQMQMD